MENFYIHENISNLINYKNNATLCFSTKNDTFFPFMFGKTRYKHYDIMSGSVISLEQFDCKNNIIGNIIFDYTYLLLKSNIKMNYFSSIKSKFDNTKILNYKMIDCTKPFLNENFKKTNTNTIIFYSCENNINFEYLPKYTKKLVIIESNFDNLDSLSSEIKLEELIIWDCGVENINIFKNYSKKLKITIYGDLPNEFNLHDFNKNIQIKTIIL